MRYHSFLLLFISFCYFPIWTIASGVSKENNTHFLFNRGAIIRGDTTQKNIALVFTGDEYADGGKHIRQVLGNQNIKASFFLTGKFYRNQDFNDIIIGLKSDGHYLGAHSDNHLLYCQIIMIR